MNIPLPVIVHFSQGPVHGEVWDIGAGGAFILCERKPATGEKVAIIFASREGDDFVTIEGTVVRSTNDQISRGILGKQVGITTFIIPRQRDRLNPFFHVKFENLVNRDIEE